MAEDLAFGFHEPWQSSYQGAVESLRWLVVPLFLCGALVSRPAAAGLSARLIYLRSGTAESCPDQVALKKAVAKRLGYDPFLVAATHTIVAEMSGDGAELQARARLLDDEGIVLGTREFNEKDADCSELLSSLALAISLTLDPMMVVTEPGVESSPIAVDSIKWEASPAPPPVVAEAPKSVEEPAVKASSTDKARRARTTKLAVHAGLQGNIGYVPAPSYAPMLGLTLRSPRVSLGLEGVVVAPQTEATKTGLRATVSLAYVAVSPCFWLGPIGTCATGSIGRYGGQGGGIERPKTGSNVHAATGLRLTGMVPLSTRWALGVAGEGVRTLTRPAFQVAGQTIFRPTGWAADLRIFAAFRLF